MDSPGNGPYASQSGFFAPAHRRQAIGANARSRFAKMSLR